MFRQSPRNRGQRSNKGLKVKKHGLQLILLVGIGIWLIYQTKNSYNKDKALSEGAKLSLSRRNVPLSTRLRFGRKDLPDLGGVSSESGDGSESGSKEEDKNEEKRNVEDSNEKKDEEMDTKEGDAKIENSGLSNGIDKESSNKDINEEENSESNTTAFSDETFASHSQNETDEMSPKITERSETSGASYQLNSNGGDTTTFSDTNGSNEELTRVENPGSSLSLAYQKIESLNPKNNEEGDSSVVRDVKDRVDLNTLPNSSNESNSKDVIAK